MIIVRDAPRLSSFAGGVFVPTMGALHVGHKALIEHAAAIAKVRRPAAPVIVSLFVNPTQFNDRSDFDHYPRDEAADLRMCEAACADCVFAPSVEAIYPTDQTSRELPLPEVATMPELEDAHRPGHFAGVCQVCARLFELVRPSCAVFGEKDWQQLAVITALARTVAPSLEIVPHPTVREMDGLAMSSRNVRLAPNHRRQAISLVKSLSEASKHQGAAEAETAGRRVLLASRIKPEYFVIRDAATLLSPQPDRPCRALVAARVGQVRLIDNAPWPGFTFPERGA